MRKKVIAGNWKMNKTLTEANQFIDDVVGKVPAEDKVEAIVCDHFRFYLL